MDKFIGPLLLASTLMGLLLLPLSAVWLIRRGLNSFKKIAVSFISLGAVVPAVIAPTWSWIDKHGSPSVVDVIERVALWLWPTSIALLALDSPQPLPWSTIAFVYGSSIVANIGLYGTVGLVIAMVYNHAARAKVVRLQDQLRRSGRT